MTDAAVEIHPVDPEYRKLIVLVLVVVCLAAVLGVLLLDHRLGELQLMALSAPADAAVELRATARWLFVAIGGGALVGAALLFRLAVRVAREGRYPPSRSRVLRDTRVARGRRARAIAAVVAALGVLLLMAGAVVSWRAERALDRALRNVIELQPWDATGPSSGS